MTHTAGTGGKIATSFSASNGTARRFFVTNEVLSHGTSFDWLLSVSPCLDSMCRIFPKPKSIHIECFPRASPRSTSASSVFSTSASPLFRSSSSSSNRRSSISIRGPSTSTHLIDALPCIIHVNCRTPFRFLPTFLRLFQLLRVGSAFFLHTSLAACTSDQRRRQSSSPLRTFRSQDLFLLLLAECLPSHDGRAVDRLGFVVHAQASLPLLTQSLVPWFPLRIASAQSSFFKQFMVFFSMLSSSSSSPSSWALVISSSSHWISLGPLNALRLLSSSCPFCPAARARLHCTLAAVAAPSGSLRRHACLRRGRRSRWLRSSLDCCVCVLLRSSVGRCCLDRALQFRLHSLSTLLGVRLSRVSLQQRRAIQKKDIAHPNSSKFSRVMCALFGTGTCSALSNFSSRFTLRASRRPSLV